jgi:tetratricopeptide (TPR) repeat protein
VPGQATEKPSSAPAQDLEEVAAKVRSGRFDEALLLLRQQAPKHPEWAPAQLILARLLFAANQGLPARRALERAAVEAPDHPEVYLTLGSVAMNEGRFSDAKLNFEKALALTGAGRGDTAQARILRREALAALATVAERREDWKAALAHLNAWLALEPKNGQIRQRLGRALFQLGKDEEAYAALSQAVKETPALEPAAVSMAWLYSMKGDVKNAEQWFDRALEAEPKSARVHVARGDWLLKQGHAAAAGSEVEAALKLDPALKEAQKLKALIAWHRRDLPAAEAILQPLHRDMPSDLMVANLLALTLIEQNDAAKRARGQQIAEVNSRQFPGSFEAAATLGWALYRSGQLDSAEQKLKAALSSGHATPDIAFFLARVLVDKGRKDDARALLQSVIKLPGAFAHRDEANALLKTLTK